MLLLPEVILLLYFEGIIGMDRRASHGDEVVALSPTETAAIGRRRIKQVVDAQTELFEMLEKTSRQWLDRVESEVRVASELSSRLTAARSISDAMTACHEWTSRRIEMMAEDGKHLLDDTRALTEAAARSFSHSWLAGHGYHSV
jgi:hypothetical protein